MPQFVSKRHKEIAEILRKEYGDKLIAWPDPEINIGKLAGITGLANLRCDFFIWINDKCGVALEYQSEIHKDKVIFDSDINKIQGRDDYKKGLLARLGIGLIEIYPEDPYDIDTLKERINYIVKIYPEISFTLKEQNDKIVSKLRSNSKLRGNHEWAKRSMKSTGKLKSRPFKRS